MSANYKDTLLLPKTDFPMKADLVKREPERLARWEAAGLYRQILEARVGAPLFVLHDGPPFANGDVHMGTALNKILKDLVVKSRSMLGFRAPFVPGWDCHGLPIEFKVVKEQRGLEPAEIRRRAEAFARKYIEIQRGQFKRLGVFGSWEEPYLTLAPGYEADIIRAFGKFVEKGLVYQSKKPVYWSTGAQTALAEAEVEYAQRTDPAIFVKFALSENVPPYLQGASMVIWTTTPWTLPANVAIAVHPKENYVVREFRRGEQREKLVIAESLVSSFMAATGFENDLPQGSAGVPPAVPGVSPGTPGVARSAIHDTRAATAPHDAPHDAPSDHERRSTPDASRETRDAAGGTPALPGAALAGFEARHPFLDRKSKIITADFVTMETGTGQVHIAPGHGKDDYIAGQA
ncbi:MAG: class I tRNA ligase family protein, partial [Chthoniobacteraceae bacterium]